MLLGATGGSDVIDAAVVLLANDGGEIYTSDPGDLEALAAAIGTHVELSGIRRGWFQSSQGPRL